MTKKVFEGEIIEKKQTNQKEESFMKKIKRVGVIGMVKHAYKRVVEIGQEAMKKISVGSKRVDVNKSKKNQFAKHLEGIGNGILAVTVAGLMTTGITEAILVGGALYGLGRAAYDMHHDQADYTWKDVIVNTLQDYAYVTAAAFGFLYVLPYTLIGVHHVFQFAFEIAVYAWAIPTASIVG